MIGLGGWSVLLLSNRKNLEWLKSTKFIVLETDVLCGAPGKGGGVGSGDRRIKKNKFKKKSERQLGKTYYINMVLRDNQDNLWP